MYLPFLSGGKFDFRSRSSFPHVWEVIRCSVLALVKSGDDKNLINVGLSVSEVIGDDNRDLVRR